VLRVIVSAAAGPGTGCTSNRLWQLSAAAGRELPGSGKARR